MVFYHSLQVLELRRFSPYPPVRVLSALTPQRSEEVGELAGLRLCRSDYSHQGGESLLMDAPALRQREGLVVVRLEAEKRADLSKDATEARSCLERFAPPVTR